MKWNKFRLKTTTEAEDIVSSMLMDLGVQGIEIEDKIPMTQAEKEQNNGEVAGQTVFHFHMHLIPRYKNDKSGFGWIPVKLRDEDRDEILEKLKEK